MLGADEVSVRHLLQSYLNCKNGLPNIYIFENCPHLISELKGYYWGSGDLPKKVNDHALDEMRYYLMTRPQRVAPKIEKSAVQKDKERLIRILKRKQGGR